MPRKRKARVKRMAKTANIDAAEQLAELAGRMAFRQHYPRTDNPYTKLYHAWDRGWLAEQAQKEDKFYK